MKKYISIFLLGILLFSLAFFMNNIISKDRENIISKDKELKKNSTITMFVITMKHEKRLKNIEEQQKKIEKPIILFDAVKGDHLDTNRLVEEKQIDPNFNNRDDKLRKREIGCYMSHLNIYKKIKEDKLPGYTIVFEDDFLVKEKFLEEIEKIIAKLNNKDFDIIYLGQNGSNNKGTPIIDNIYHLDKSNICTGTHGLLIKNKNIDRIVEKLNYINTPIDHKIKDTGNDLIVLVIHPFIVEMTNEPSTIRNLNIENFYPVSSKYIY